MFAVKKFKEGFEYMRIKEWTKAINKFHEATGIDQRHTQSYGNMGLCYAQIGDKQKALEALDKALKIDTKYEPAIGNRKNISSLSVGEKLNLPFVVEEYYNGLVKQGR